MKTKRFVYLGHVFSSLPILFCFDIFHRRHNHLTLTQFFLFVLAGGTSCNHNAKPSSVQNPWLVSQQTEGYQGWQVLPGILNFPYTYCCESMCVCVFVLRVLVLHHLLTSVYFGLRSLPTILRASFVRTLKGWRRFVLIVVFVTTGGKLLFIVSLLWGGGGVVNKR